MNRNGTMLCEEHLFLFLLVVAYCESFTQTETFMKLKNSNITGEILKTIHQPGLVSENFQTCAVCFMFGRRYFSFNNSNVLVFDLSKYKLMELHGSFPVT